MEYCKYYNKHLDTIVAYIGCLYEIEGCVCGGLLHVMIDDDNIDDDTIKWTLEECDKHPECEECGMLLTIAVTKLEAKRLQWEREGYDDETILDMQGAALREILNSKVGMKSIKDEG